MFPAIIRIKAPENTPAKKLNIMHKAVIFAILAAISNVAMHVALPLPPGGRVAVALT